jgi:PPOX class probable F420-dependent enzyme
MPRTIATTDRVELDELLDFARDRHHYVLVTERQDGSAQVSPVTGGVDGGGRLVISSYPERAKTRNARRTGRASVLVLSDEWDGAWVQIDGDVEVLDAVSDGSPDDVALDAFEDYFRCISGEHPDWAEYRQAMVDQDKSLLRITPTRWGPIATGGFPARLA